MLITIDVGNSTTVFGVFEGKKLKKIWSVETRDLAAHLPGGEFEAVVSSVVPDADKYLKKRFPKAFFVTADNIKGIKVRAKKSEIGADRVVNALAAYKLFGGPAIVVDFGTATTFDIISKRGEYLGGVIAPGLGLQARILHQATAKLPEIKIADAKRVIGKTTQDAILSGLIYGYVSMTEGLIERIRLKLKSPRPKLKVIATGGFAKLIAKHTSRFDIIDPDITLKGLRIAWEAAR